MMTDDVADESPRLPLSFIRLGIFNKELKALGKRFPLILNDLDGLLALLEINPQIGEPLGMDCYKIRMSIS